MLLLSSYQRLAEATAGAAAAFADDPQVDRAFAAILAHRRWALDHRGEFNLIFSDQLPGYEAPPGGPTVDAEIAVFKPVIDALAGLTPTDPEPTETQLVAYVWGAFHGIVTLEVNNHVDWVGDTEMVHEIAVRRHLRPSGCPRHRPMCGRNSWPAWIRGNQVDKADVGTPDPDLTHKESLLMSPIRSRSALRLLPVLALPVAALVVGQSASASTTPPTVPGDSTPAATIPEGYVRLVDDTALLTVFVPETWTTVDTAPVVNDDGSSRPLIFASAADAETFGTTFASGVIYSALPYEADPEAIITAGGLSNGCETTEVQPYEDPIFIGSVQVGTNCGPSGGTWNMVVASPADQSFTAVVQLQIESPADQEAFDIVLQTFTYAGDPTVPPEVMVPSIPGSTVPG